MSKIKFLATGDFHSNLELIDKIKNNAQLSEMDFIFLTGDISEKADDFAVLLNIFKNKKVFMVPGNHESKESIDILKKYYNIELIGNKPIMLHEDLTIFGTNYLNIGPFGIPEEEVFENLIDNFNAIKHVKNKVMLSHMPPTQTQIGDASPYFPFISGSVAIRDFLEHFSPEFALVGHIHETSGLEEIVNKTKVINVAQTFKIFEFDTEKRELRLV